MSRLTLGCFLALAPLLLVTMAFHELGHDEAQAWNLARASTWPWDVVANGRVEGHTPFWHLVLWPFTLLGKPVAMQLLGVSLSLGAAFLLLRDRPFPLVFCVLIVSGYYPFYQYGIFPRPYSLALFLSAAIAGSLYAGRGTYVLRSLLCGLLAFTSAFGVAMSAGLMLLVVSETLPVRRKGGGIGPAWQAVMPGVAIYTLFVGSSCWLILFPLHSTALEATIASGGRIGTTGFLHAVESAFFPQYDRLPLGIGQWLHSDVVGRIAMAVVTFGLVTLFAVWLWPRPVAVIAWLLSVLGVGFAAMYSGFNAERYSGHLFLAALAIAWAAPGLRVDEVLARRCFGRTIPGPAIVRSGGGMHVVAAGILCVLLYQTVVNVAVSVLDVREKQSPWRDMATDLNAAIDGPFRIMATFGYDAGPLAAYLDEPLYDLRCDCWTRFTEWDRARPSGASAEIDATFCALAREHGTMAAIVTRELAWPDKMHFPMIGEYRPGYRDSGDATVRVYRTGDDTNARPACRVDG